MPQRTFRTKGSLLLPAFFFLQAGCGESVQGSGTGNSSTGGASGLGGEGGTEEDAGSSTGGRSEVGDGGAGAGTGGASVDPDPGECATPSRPCEEEFDGVGICQAGTQECTLDEDGAEVWGECEDFVRPQEEVECGPGASGDVDCDGIWGNGTGCARPVGLYTNSETSCPFDGNTIARDLELQAPPGYTLFDQLNLLAWNESDEATPVHNCTAKWSYMSVEHLEPFVNVGGCREHESTGVVGYVSPTELPGYSAVEKGHSTWLTVGPSQQEEGVLVSSCPSGCSCDSYGFYVF